MIAACYNGVIMGCYEERYKIVVRSVLTVLLRCYTECYKGFILSFMRSVLRVL